MMLGPLKLWWQQQTDTLQGRAPVGAKRSPQWPTVAADHLADHPTCACCGGRAKLRVHHIQPFYLRPDLELDPANLITLCEAERFGVNCHLLIGHHGNWRKFNPIVTFDAWQWNQRLTRDHHDTLKAFIEWKANHAHL